MTPDPSQGLLPEYRNAADPFFQRGPSLVHQIVAHMMEKGTHRRIRLGSMVRLVRHFQGRIGDFQLCHTHRLRAAGNLLYDMPVAITGMEIHPRIDLCRIRKEDSIYPADRLKDIRPIELGQTAQTGYGVRERG